MNVVKEPLWKYRPANDIKDKKWKDILPEGVLDQIKDTDFFNLISFSEEDIKKIQENPIQKNRISVVLSVYDGDDLLPHTFKALVRQIKKAGLHGEIFIVLNRGGGTTANYLNSENAENIKKDLGLSEVAFTKSTRDHLSKTDKDNAKIPGNIQLDSSHMEDRDSNDVKLIVVEQDNIEANAGKIRGLRDAYNFLFDISTRSNFRPEFLFSIDAETILHPRDEETGAVDLENDNSLLSLIKKTKNGEVIVGAKSEFIPFKEGKPDWDAEIYVPTAMLNGVHGISPTVDYVPLSKFGNSEDSPLSFLCGGAILGDYASILGLMRNISTIFPGIRTEDTFLSIATRLLSIRTSIDQGVVHLNRCPDVKYQDRKAFSKDAITKARIKIKSGASIESVLIDSELQMTRWLQGNAGIQNVIPKDIYHLCSRDFDPTSSNGNSYIKNLKLRRNINYSKEELLWCLYRFNTFIQDIVKNSPDDIKEGKASWFR